MKKKLFVLILACITVLHCFPAYATMWGDETEKELKPDEELILETANKLLSSYFDFTITAEELDYENTVKGYLDVDARDLESDDIAAERMQQIDNESKQNGIKTYTMPLNKNGKHILLQIRAVTPISKDVEHLISAETIEFTKKNLGRWHVSQIDEYTVERDIRGDIEKFAEKNNLDANNVDIMAGFEGPYTSAVAFWDENGVPKFVEYNEETGQFGDRFYTIAEAKAILDKTMPIVNVPEGEFPDTGSGIIENNIQFVLLVTAASVAMMSAMIFIGTKSKKRVSANDEIK